MGVLKGDVMTGAEMPYNVVGEPSGEPSEEPSEEAREEAWRASNLPAGELELAWRYAHGELQLYERRIRSLAAYGVGPAVGAWVRSRLEWMVEERLSERPDGVLVLTITPEGDVGMALRDVAEAPALRAESLVWDADGRLAGCEVAGSVWQVAGGEARMRDAGGLEVPRAAADTFARDVLRTMGIEVREGGVSRGDAGDGELFVISDEHGVTGCEGASGPAVEKLELCFERLWG